MFVSEQFVAEHPELEGEIQQSPDQAARGQVYQAALHALSQYFPGAVQALYGALQMDTSRSELVEGLFRNWGIDPDRFKTVNQRATAQRLVSIPRFKLLVYTLVGEIQVELMKQFNMGMKEAYDYARPMVEVFIAQLMDALFADYGEQSDHDFILAWSQHLSSFSPQPRREILGIRRVVLEMVERAKGRFSWGESGEDGI